MCTKYEMPVHRGSANLTQECILGLLVPDTPMDSATLYYIYTESGPHRRHRQLFQALLPTVQAGLVTRPRVLRLA